MLFAIVSALHLGTRVPGVCASRAAHICEQLDFTQPVLFLSNHNVLLNKCFCSAPVLAAVSEYFSIYIVIIKVVAIVVYIVLVVVVRIVIML